VNTPLIDPDDNNKGLGYSTYFALDVTDPVNPRLLWEFSHDELGFATTGPAIVRINGTTSGSSNIGTNGNWFAVFGSGPTGPITPEHQFLGHSDQSLKLFILDLRTGTLLRKMDSEMSIANAFAGSLNNGAVDVHEPSNGLQNYQDDVVYVPYVKKSSAGASWTDGGVGRLVTKQDPDPSTWEWSTLIDNVGPVTSAVSKLEDTNSGNLWLYFGTGRYYYVQGSSIDDPSGQRHLVGLKDPCYNNLGFDPTCTAGVLFGNLTDVTDVADVPSVQTANSSALKGWYIRLDPNGSYTYPPDPATNFMAERVITDSLATGQGTVFFTSYKPYTDLCNFGGKTFIWGVNYNTGGVPLNLKGKVLIQVSTGAIEQKDLSSAFTAAGGRKTAAMEGKPPEAQGMSIIGAPGPTKKVVHIKER
jgi:type IV pilus assembly protein PilY1